MSNSIAREPGGIALSLRLHHPGFRLEVELGLHAAGVTALFGDSGSGKTTLLRLLAGLERGEGSLHVLGECWQDSSRGVFVPPHRRSIGYVFQEPSLFPHLTVRQNLAYAERRKRYSAASPDFDTVVSLLGIERLLGRVPERLSGGERQRVAIARALLAAPRLLLMDEPLAALDQARKAEVLPYLERLRDELSVPIIYVSHAIDEVARLANRIVLLQAGRVAAAGAISDLLCRLDLPFSQGDHAGVVIDAEVGAHDWPDCLSRLDFAGGSLWVSQVNRPLGSPVRARVLSRDVSLALSPPGPCSIVNILPALVTQLSDDGPDRVNVRLSVSSGPVALLARITRRSLHSLQLGPGSEVFAQVKSVALTDGR